MRVALVSTACIAAPSRLRSGSQAALKFPCDPIRVPIDPLFNFFSDPCHAPTNAKQICLNQRMLVIEKGTLSKGHSHEGGRTGGRRRPARRRIPVQNAHHGDSNEAATAERGCTFLVNWPAWSPALYQDGRPVGARLARAATPVPPAQASSVASHSGLVLPGSHCTRREQQQHR